MVQISLDSSGLHYNLDNPGSWGHPFLYRRPCVYVSKSAACRNAGCQFCHHTDPAVLASGLQGRGSSSWETVSPSPNRGLGISMVVIAIRWIFHKLICHCAELRASSAMQDHRRTSKPDRSQRFLLQRFAPEQLVDLLLPHIRAKLREANSGLTVAVEISLR